MSKRKYQPGEVITSLDELMKQEFIYINDKIQHHGWFGSWDLRLAQQLMTRGILRYAEKIQGGNTNG